MFPQIRSPLPTLSIAEFHNRGSHYDSTLLFYYRWSCILSLLFFLPLVVLFAQTNEELASLRWHQWDEGVAATQASGKYVLVDVYTDWCGWCKKMDRAVYGHPQVQQLLAASFVLI